MKSHRLLADKVSRQVCFDFGIVTDFPGWAHISDVALLAT